MRILLGLSSSLVLLVVALSSLAPAAEPYRVGMEAFRRLASPELD